MTMMKILPAKGVISKSVVNGTYANAPFFLSISNCSVDFALEEVANKPFPATTARISKCFAPFPNEWIPRRERNILQSINDCDKRIGKPNWDPISPNRLFLPIIGLFEGKVVIITFSHRSWWLDRDIWWSTNNWVQCLDLFDGTAYKKWMWILVSKKVNSEYLLQRYRSQKNWIGGWRTIGWYIQTMISSIPFLVKKIHHILGKICKFPFFSALC